MNQTVTWARCTLLLLMDDTVILATTRERCLQKVSILLEFCENSGMEINVSKTKFMVLNGSSTDREPLRGTEIVNCDTYVYLGATFTQDGNVQSAIDLHCRDKRKHVEICCLRQREYGLPDMGQAGSI